MMTFTDVALLVVTESWFCLQSIAVSCEEADNVLDLHGRVSAVGHKDLSLEHFAGLPKLGHLQVTLHEAGSYPGWSVRVPWQGDSLHSICDLPPHLQCRQYMPRSIIYDEPHSKYASAAMCITAAVFMGLV